MKITDSFIFKSLSEGKKARRKAWNADYFIQVHDGIVCMKNDGGAWFGINDIGEDDWEIIQELTFGEVLPALKQGYRVSRQGWHGNVWLEKQEKSIIRCMRLYEDKVTSVRDIFVDELINDDWYVIE